jgi:hypothetical protein
MRRVLTAAVLLLPFAGAGGCAAWQANKGSQAVDINPLAVGSGEPVISPSNSYGYLDGVPLDMRSKH